MSCRSAPTSTCTRGAPVSPSGAHPSRPRSAPRARRGRAAEVGHRPAGDEPDVGAGRQPEQVEQPGAGTSSIAAAAGVANRSPVFWSQALTSQSAASAAGSVAPITQPKKRPDWIAIRPGSAFVASISMTSAGRDRAPAAGRRTPPPVRRRPSAAPPVARRVTPARTERCSAARASAGSKSAVTSQPFRAIVSQACQSLRRSTAEPERRCITSRPLVDTAECGPSSVPGHRF